MAEDASSLVKRAPHELIKKADVAATLKKDKGHGASLLHYSIVNFTSKGDHEASAVTSLEVDYELDGNKRHVSYVVKLNPKRDANFDSFTRTLFRKEYGFFTEILPQMNKELESLPDERPLRVPRLIHAETEDKNEAYYFADLRPHNYRLANKKLGLDREHAALVMEEMARFHASSVLMMSRKKYDGVDMVERYDFLEEFFDAIRDEKSTVNIDTFFPGMAESAADIAESFEGYERVTAYLRQNKDRLPAIFKQQLATAPQFRVIGHGDCWTNNFMFRYSEANGSVEECMLMDLQMVRVGSVALDLNMTVYCSLSGEVRKEHLTHLLLVYYESFGSVMAKAKKPMPFTLAELHQEFQNKNVFGLIMGLMLVPFMITDPQDAPKMEDFYGDDMEAKKAEYQQKNLEYMKTNPLIKPMLLSLFDDMMKSGAIP